MLFSTFGNWFVNKNIELPEIGKRKSKRKRKKKHELPKPKKLKSVEEIFDEENKQKILVDI